MLEIIAGIFDTLVELFGMKEKRSRKYAYFLTALAAIAVVFFLLGQIPEVTSYKP
ncbi:hypothetical protein ACWGS9_26720 [Bradyrhizobium sp. Arg314]